VTTNMKHIFPILILSVTAMSEARDLFEVEPNNTPSTAYDPGFLQHGDRLRGQITGNPEFFDADFWWLKTPDQAPGIYENQLRLITSIRIFDGRIFGTFENGVTTPVQYTEENRYVDVFTRWYSFGRQARVNYAMVGSSQIPRDYVAAYEQVRITPTDLGQFAPGEFRIHHEFSPAGSDVQIFGLDHNYEVVPSLTRAGTASDINLRTDLRPGKYTIALGFGSISSENLDPANQNFPSYRIYGENALVNNGASSFFDAQAPLVSFSTASFTRTLDWRSEVRSRGTHSLAYYQFEVVPEGDAGIALAVGIGALAMTRRRSS